MHTSYWFSFIWKNPDRHSVGFRRARTCHRFILSLPVLGDVVFCYQAGLKISILLPQSLHNKTIGVCCHMWPQLSVLSGVWY